MKEIYSHFSHIASKYKDLRTTDKAPIVFIKKRLKNINKLVTADIGCGVGRYVIKLFHYLGEKLYLVCIDENKGMLNHLTKNLKEHRIKNFKPIKAEGENLPLANESLDSIFTFNAIHHFNTLDFLKESARVLRNDGYLFIYTRLQSQNKRTVWGKYFPGFYEKEERLYEMCQFEEMIGEISILELESIEYFKYRRETKLKTLITCALHHHYSTFCLYKESEFGEALRIFQENTIRHFKNPDKIIWNDENIMLVIRKSIKS